MRFALLFSLVLLLSGCNPRDIVKSGGRTTVPPAQKPTKAKNVILMIGDGMGLTQITAGMYSNSNKLQLERLPIVGLHKSYASDNLITDSAAGATAFSAGIKTYNGAIGVDPDTLPHRTILEEAEERGLATGLVATSTIVHATPASFISHQKSRRMYEAIAADFLKTEIDYFVGGGKKFFDRRETDERNLYNELINNNYVVSDYFKKELKDLVPNIEKNFAYFTSDGDPLKVVQGRDYLTPASTMGIDFLAKRSQKGFFMMIEGSQIDWGGHANESEYIITEMLDFDKAIGEVMDFAERDGETLVVITADHETGGYSILNGSRMDSLSTAFTSDYHTAVMIPVFAYGPGAESFSGIYENTAIYGKMRKALGFAASK